MAGSNNTVEYRVILDSSGVKAGAAEATQAIGGINGTAAAKSIEGVAAEAARMGTQVQAGAAKASEGMQQVAQSGTDAASGTQSLRKAQADVTSSAPQYLRVIGSSNDLHRNGAISAAQHAQAMRMLPMQMTDVVTSIASGMPIWMVAIQQGGQIKDSFGSAGAAARAMAGAITPATAAMGGLAVGAGLVAAAYYQGSAEQDKFRQITVLNGNAAGVTAEALSRMSREVDGIYGTQSKAAEGLAILASSGKIARDGLVEFTTMAVRMEDLAGRSIEQTAKELEQLGTKPAEASAKLNESYNYLTPAVYRQIRALEDQGKSEEAAALAQKTYSDAMSARTKQLEGELGYIERGWRGARDLAKEAWDAFLNIGRPTTVQDQAEEQIKALEEDIRRHKQRNADLGIKNGKALAEKEARLDNAQGLAQLSQSAAKATADAIDQENKKRQDGIDLQRESAKYDSDAVKMRREITQAEAKYGELAKTDAQARKDLEQLIGGIREKYTKKGGSKGTGGIHITDTEMASMRSQLVAAQQYHQQLLTMGSGAIELNTAERESLKIGEQIKLATDGKTIARLKEKQAIADTLATQLRSNEGLEQSYKAHQQVIDANYKDAQSIGQRARDQAAANEVFGKGRTAIEQMTLATLEHQLAEAEGSDSFDPKYIASLREKIAAQKDWVAALGQADYKGVKQRADELLRSAQAMGQSYKEEAELSGLSATQRQIITAQRQVELRYAKEVAEVDKLNLGDAEKQAALATLEQARLQELANASAKVNLQVWSESVQQYDDVFRKGFADMLNNGKSGWEAFNTSLVTTFKTSVADQLYKAFAQPFIVPVIANIQGIIGSITGGNSGNTAGGNAAGLVQSGMNIASVGKNISSAITGGFEALSGQVAGYVQSGMNLVSGSGGMISQGPIQMGGFAQGAGAAAGVAAGVAGGVYGGRLVSGGYSAWGGSSGNSAVNTGTAIGAAVGSIFPVIGTALGALVGGLLGGATNRLFGHKLKDQGIEGQFGGEDAFQGNSYKFLKGGWFRSDKTERSALDEELRKGLADQYTAMRLGTSAMAEELGLGTAAVNSFTAGIKVSFNGLDEEGIQKRLAEEFDKIAESMAAATLGTTAYNRTGETSVEAITRLSGSLVSVNAVLENLNSTLYSSSLAGADMASSLIGLFGDAGSFNTVTGGYFQNFYSAQEQRDAAERALQRQLDAVHLTLPDIDATDARAQLRALADAQNLMTEEGRKAWAVIMQVSGAFAGLTQAMPDQSQREQQERETVEKTLAQQHALWADLAAAQGDNATAAQRRYWIETAGMTLAEQAAYDYIAAIRQQVTAAQAASQALKQLGDNRFALENELLTAQGNLSEVARRQRERDLAELTKDLDAEQAAKVTAAYDYNNALRAQIDAQRAANEAAQAQADAAQRAAEAARSLMDEWQSSADGIYKEVQRIRGLNGDNAAQTLSAAQAQFAIAQAQARAGDVEAAKALPELSRALLTIAESSATSLIELRRIQGQTASSLQQTGDGLVSKYGLQLPSFDVGTNYVPHDMIAQIHKGEMIVPAAFNPAALLGMLGQSSDPQIVDLLQRILDVLDDIQHETRSTAINQADVAKSMQRVLNPSRSAFRVQQVPTA